MIEEMGRDAGRQHQARCEARAVDDGRARAGRCWRMTAWRESATISDLIRHGPVRSANVIKKNLVKGMKYRSCLLDKSGAVALPSYRHTPLRFGVVLRCHLAPLALVPQHKETQRADRIRFDAG